MKKKFKALYALKKLALGAAVVVSSVFTPLPSVVSAVSLLGAAVVALPVFTSCEKDKPVVPKKDVRIGWEIDGENRYSYVLNEQAINALKSKPETGNIIAYVANDDGRGPPKQAIPSVLNVLERAKSMGVKFEEGTLYVYEFEKADSIRARQLPLILDLFSRRGK